MLARIFLINIILSFCICAEAKILRIAGLEVYPHVKFTQASKIPEGYAAPFLEKHLGPGIKSKFDMTLEWSQAPAPRLFIDLETNNLDVLFFLVKTPEREKKYKFSKAPFLIDSTSMIVSKDLTDLSELKNYDLFKNKTITLMTGTYAPAFLKENNISVFSLGDYDISEKTLNLVATKKIDGIFIPIYSIARSLVKVHKYEDRLKVVRLPHKAEAYIVYSKKLDPEVQKYVDDVLLKHRDEYLRLVKEK